MAPLVVEYAKSGRSKCSVTSCKKTIAKHEVRIGTVITLPFSDEGTESVKWRHLCCFTDRQIKNAEASGELDNIRGFEDLAPSDRALVEQMKRGELVGKSEVIGRIGDVANSPIAAALGADDSAKKPKPKPKRKATAAGGAAGAPRKKAAKAEKPAAEDDVDSDATEEYEVEVRDVSAKPKCPYGANCFRTAADHFAQFSHDGDDESSAPGDSNGGGSMKQPVIVGKKETPKRARSPAA